MVVRSPKREKTRTVNTWRSHWIKWIIHNSAMRRQISITSPNTMVKALMFLGWAHKWIREGRRWPMRWTNGWWITISISWQLLRSIMAMPERVIRFFPISFLSNIRRFRTSRNHNSTIATSWASRRLWASYKSQWQRWTWGSLSKAAKRAWILSCFTHNNRYKTKWKTST